MDEKGNSSRDERSAENGGHGFAERGTSNRHRHRALDDGIRHGRQRNGRSRHGRFQS